MSTYFSRSDINFSFPAGAQGAVVRDLFLADVNGDGRQDAVVTYEYYPLQNQPIAVRVLTGDGHGGFAADASGVFSGAAPSFVDAKAHALVSCSPSVPVGVPLPSGNGVTGTKWSPKYDKRPNA